MRKKVARVVNSVDVMMGPIKIGQPIPSAHLEQISPFILLHHGAPKTYGPGEMKMHIGAHPHRGFEPVTFVFSGEVDHKDSLGNSRIVKDGGVQWITAGSGVVHEEGASTAFKDAGGTFEMIQLWINLPAEYKMSEAKYQPFDREEIPFFEAVNTRVNVIAGEVMGLKGPVDSITDVQALTVEAKNNGHVTLDIDQNRNVLLYQLHGNSIVNGTAVGDQQVVVFQEGETGIEIESVESSLFLLVTGFPIDEPMVSYGPFIMNTSSEIQRAIFDYQEGKMGAITT